MPFVQYDGYEIFYVGKKDALYAGAKASADQIRHAYFHGFDDMGHVEAFIHSGYVLPLVLAFLGQI